MDNMERRQNPALSFRNPFFSAREPAALNPVWLYSSIQLLEKRRSIESFCIYRVKSRCYIKFENFTWQDLLS